MKVVVDTNIVFSALLNTNNRLAKLLLLSKNKIHLYSPYLLFQELEEHSGKLKKLASYSEREFKQATTLITKKIRFINSALIPADIYQKSIALTSSVDIDDTEFVALTEHLKGRLWSGDKKLVSGLAKQGWSKIISTEELYRFQLKK